MIPQNISLVLIAHGSRKASANLEVVQVAKSLSEKLQHPVIPCFLELGKPDIPTGIDLALQESPEQIWLLPYFLTKGRHLQEDIPKIIEEKAKAHPEVEMKLLDYLGAQKALIDTLALMIQTSLRKMN